MVEIERRTYGPDSTEPELTAIRARVSIVSTGVLMYRELPVTSAFSVDVMFDRVTEISAEMELFVFVADVSDCDRPNLNTRRRLVARLSQLHEQVPLLVAITGGSAMARAATRFVLGRSGIPVKICASESQALAEASSV